MNYSKLPGYSPIDTFLQFIEISLVIFYFLKILFIFFRVRAREGEREGEKHRCMRDTSIDCLSLDPNWGPDPITQAFVLVGNPTGGLLVHRLELNPLSYTSQGCYILDARLWAINCFSFTSKKFWITYMTKIGITFFIRKINKIL